LWENQTPVSLNFPSPTSVPDFFINVFFNFRLFFLFPFGNYVYSFTAYGQAFSQISRSLFSGSPVRTWFTCLLRMLLCSPELPVEIDIIFESVRVFAERPSFFLRRTSSLHSSFVVVDIL